MFEPEEVAGSFDVVKVQVAETDHIEIVALACGEIAFEFGGQIAALVGFVIPVEHIGVVHQDFATVGKVEAAGVGVAGWEKRDRGGHFAVLMCAGRAAWLIGAM